MTNSIARLTVGDLRAALAEIPDWAAVEVTYLDDELAIGSSSEDIFIDYSRGVLTIEAG
ncbi:hypothetical protein ACFQWA_00010 [Streptomyces thermogriseus]|uniref:Uncharacterized protein n=1 Tax=Streptomyces thermogriseus TaxID=75292 RepID=A0ABN1T156_9ACTN